MKTLKPELLAPAGNLEKLKYAIHYGADAVYLGLPTFGLRSNKNAFNWEDLEYGIQYAHDRNVRVFVAANIFARNHELERIPEYFKKLNELKPDGIIVGDVGIMELIKEYMPDTEIHISTQSSIMNWSSAKFWHNYGAKRIVLARELSLKEIATIKEKNPDLEIETFVHGAMCMAFSGRCMISSYLNMRDANHGDCTNACRWNYKLVEETRPGEYYPVVEDEYGTYFFNAKDLCLISYIPDLIKSGVCSFKIEGRTKSNYYLSIVTRAYRKAIDSYMADPENYDPIPFLKEVMTTSNRTFSSAFIGNEKDSSDLQNYASGIPVQYYDFVASVQFYDTEQKVAIIEGRNQIKLGDIVEFVTKDNIITKKIDKILTLEGESVIKVDPNKSYKIDLDQPVDSYTLVRRRNVKITNEEMENLINEQYISLGQGQLKVVKT
ncbi:MAG: U32 family peptidase [Candidatus Sericytochromatia bacterium]|nr:U32 family peptidase [Candidatus Sericytochromatia bacterium]